MRRIFFSFIPALVLVMAFATGCQSVSSTNYKGNENHRHFAVDASGGSYRITLFPKTYSALAGPAFSLVIVSPVLVRDEYLYNSGSSSLIPWFNARGVSVWLVYIPQQTNIEKFGREVLPTVTTAIRQNSNEENWVMGGISLGGQAIAHYLDEAPRNATVSGMLVKAAFFIGTGFDYGYPGSFGRRLAAVNDPGSLCAGDFCKRYLPGIDARFAAERRWLNDASGKPVWRDSLENVILRDKGVRTLFIAGKIDNVAPSESVYKYFVKTIGDETKNSPDCRFLQPGRMNRHSDDFNHRMLLGSDELASDVLPDVLKWIDL